MPQGTTRDHRELRLEFEGRNPRDRDAIAVAVALTMLLHLLILWLAPSHIFLEEPQSTEVSDSIQVELQTLPDEPEMEETYVRATPNVEEETPEETSNISDRDQVAAQPEEVPQDPENTPYVEGDMEDSNRLVQGMPQMQPAPETASNATGDQDGSSPMPQQQAAPDRKEQTANPDFEDQEPETEEGIASVEDPAQAEELPEEEPEDQDQVQVAENQSRTDGQGQDQVTTPPQASENPSQQPRPRQRIERDTSYGPIKDNRQGAVRVGNLAWDTNYSEFGEYWRRVAEIIEARWRNLVYNTKSIQHGGYRVVVTFEITRKGEIQNLRIEDSTAGKLAETISVDAIEAEAPFYDWTPEMILKMGDSIPASIRFYY